MFGLLACCLAGHSEDQDIDGNHGEIENAYLDDGEHWPSCFSSKRYVLDDRIQPITLNTGKRKTETMSNSKEGCAEAWRN